MDWVLPLSQVDSDDVRRVGGKGAALARLVERGLPVPAGFVVPVEALGATLDHADLVGLARQLRRDPTPQLATQLRDALCEAALPPDLSAALEGAARELGGRLAVRSSAVDEDGRERSFAGQYETVLNVRRGQGLEDAVRTCWASWYGERAMAYRRRGLRRLPLAGMAVLVQRLVDARASGVLFTVHPVSGSWTEMTLEAAWGQGEALVSGQVVPDRYRLRRPRRGPGRLRRALGRWGLSELGWEPSDQEQQLLPGAEGELEWRASPRGQRVLTPQQVLTIGRYGLMAEHRTGTAQDVEWALDAEGRVQVLQARAVTAVGEPERSGRVLWTRRFVGERWTEPASPCGWSIVGPLLEWFIEYPETSRRFLGGAGPTRVFRGWPYFNVTVFRHLAFKLPGRPPPRFMLEFLPPEEADSWMRRFALPADARVYGSILRATVQEQRWRRFRANPFTNPRAWDQLERRLDRDIPALAASEEPAVARVRAGIELARDYIKVHICSLLFANLTFQVAENLVPSELRDDLLRCPTENWTQRTNRALHGLASGGSVEAFLADYGFRGAASSWEIFSPRWGEEPERIDRLVAPYADGVLADPGEVARSQESAARAALSALSGRVSGPSGRALLAWVRLTRRYLQLREDQRYHFDRLLFVLKGALLDLGRSWLDEPADVRWLEWPELQALEAGTLAIEEARERLEERRARWAVYASEGRPPAFLVGDEALEHPVGGRRRRGLGISPGRVTGTVRVLHSPDEAWRLGRGDILVATATDPGWTPLFLVAGGVVLELGSMLSHGAVVAREYRVPAVVNVPDATEVLRDGARVTIDGTTGQVYLGG